MSGLIKGVRDEIEEVGKKIDLIQESMYSQKFKGDIFNKKKIPKTNKNGILIFFRSMKRKYYEMSVSEEAKQIPIDDLSNFSDYSEVTEDE